MQFFLHTSDVSTMCQIVPLQAGCGPEGSRRFRLQDFHDIQHMRVVSLSASRTGRLYPQECSWYSFSLGTELNPEPWCGEKEMSLKNPVTPPGIDPGPFQLVAHCLNHYTTPAPNYVWHCSKRMKKILHFISLQYINDFLGNEPGEKELIAIPDKARKTEPHPTV